MNAVENTSIGLPDTLENPSADNILNLTRQNKGMRGMYVRAWRRTFFWPYDSSIHYQKALQLGLDENGFREVKLTDGSLIFTKYNPQTDRFHIEGSDGLISSAFSSLVNLVNEYNRESDQRKKSNTGR